MSHLTRIALLLIFITTSLEARSGLLTLLMNEKELFTMLFSGDLSERLITTSVILMEIIILFSVVYYWKRNRNEKPNKESPLKLNIKAIRDERINPKLIELKNRKRKSLKSFINLDSFNGKTLTRKAKKLSVAKGEIILAARIDQIKKQYP